MAYYNANEVVKLTRKAIGITQEELCDGICDVSTLSKMENGHFRIKFDTYKKFMKKMGRIEEKRYAVCVDKDGMLLEHRMEWEQAYKRHDYEAAEKFLQKMIGNADDNLLTRQYIARAEALVNYKRGYITVEDMVDRIDRAIKMTVPTYEKYLQCDKTYPFVKEELLALMSMGNGYRKMGRNELGIQLYQAVLRCLDAQYISEPDNTSMAITIRYNIARGYAEIGKHVEAVREIDTCLALCRERDYSHLLVSLLSSKAHNYIQLVKRGELSDEFLSEAKVLLQQALFLATVRAESELMSRIVVFYEQHFGQV